MFSLKTSLDFNNLVWSIGPLLDVNISKVVSQLMRSWHRNAEYMGLFNYTQNSSKIHGRPLLNLRYALAMAS